jgi:hypothetical protein
MNSVGDSPDDSMSTGHWRNDTDRGKQKYCEKNVSKCHFVHHKPLMDRRSHYLSAALRNTFFSTREVTLVTGEPGGDLLAGTLLIEKESTEWSKSLCAPDDYNTNNTQKHFK